MGAGAAIGAVARHILMTIGPQGAGMLLAVNVLGCFAMGLVRPGPFWGAGVLGGFTTYSAVALTALGYSLPGAFIFLTVTFAACIAAWLAGDHVRGLHA